ncbi:MAG: hypothetical protein ACYC40_01510 [Patescibacteria group bacterium]
MAIAKINKINKSKKIKKVVKSKSDLKAKLKKIFLRPLKFSRLTLVIIGIILGLLLLFMILNFVFLFVLNKQLKQDFSTLQDDTNSRIEALSDSINNYNNSNAPAVEPSGILNSFGDHFSGLSYINEAKTTMEWDENVTAFTFPPLYSFEKIAEGTQGINDFESSTLNLKVINNELYYRGQKLLLPEDVRTENILNINVRLIGSRFLVGIVTGKTSDERGWVYFFDGVSHNFSPLITAETPERIEPKFERLGGEISFGGTADNFLIVYGGYDGHAFYYYQGTLSDVSRFFGLRVSAGGFKSQIISRNNSRGTVFYICSQTEGKPKLIKFWPKRAGELIGSLDFSPLIFSNGSGILNMDCEADEKGVLMKIKKSGGNVDGGANGATGANGVNNGTLETWRFVDNGFDNSRDREVISFDLGQNRGRKIISALISDLAIACDGLKQNGAPNSRAELFLANRENEWKKIAPYELIKFSDPTTSLFWRATFKAEPGYSDYSPWFDNINNLSYRTD